MPDNLPCGCVLRPVRGSRKPKSSQKGSSTSSLARSAPITWRSPSASSACRMPPIRSTRSTCGPVGRKRRCCRCSSREKTAIGVPELKERLRKILPEELPGIRLSFEPSDIVSRVMSFGAPTPIEVAVSGPDFAKSRQFAETIRDALGAVPALRDLGFEQELDYPAVKVDIDRQRRRDARRDRGSDRPLPYGCDVFQSVHGSQFLARSQERRRLPGPGGGACAANELDRGSQEHSDRPIAGYAYQPAERGGNNPGHGARRVRPVQHAADVDSRSQRCGRGSGPGVEQRVAGTRKDRQPATRSERGRSRPGRADAGNVQRPRNGLCWWR